MFRQIGALSVVLLVAGCNGVRFADSDENALPNDYLNRTRVANTADFRFNMAQNIGAVLEEDPAKPSQYRLAAPSVILPPGFTPTETLLAKEENTVYDQKITYGGSASASYAVIGVSLSVDEAAEIAIFDISRAEIPTPQIPVNLLHQYAQTKGPQKQYWVKSLLLSRISRTSYTKENSDATGSGPAFQVKGTVYNTHTVAVQDFNLAAVLIDLDSYRSPSAPPVSAAAPLFSLSDKELGVVVLKLICAQPLTSDQTRGSIKDKTDKGQPCH
jgi:hypothetical protein